MKKFLKITGIVLASFVGIYLLVFLINVLCNVSLRSYIKSFDPVDYTGIERKVPVKDGDYYTFVTDDDLKILYLTDIHIGGGFWTVKHDRKTVYEVISILQTEKPDLVILGGDNVYALPGIGWGGGFTFNNGMAAKTVATIFNHEQVYFSLVMGNHDTEAFDYSKRQDVGNIYMSEEFEYCIFEEMFTDLDAETIPSVTNQFILVKNSQGKITKLLLLIDSNDYINRSLAACIGMKYDVIHDAQVDWAAGVIKDLSAKEGLPEGEYLKSLMFLHIPVGEYKLALDDLITEKANGDGTFTYTVNDDPKDTEYISGLWDDDRIYYGGLNNGKAPEDCDKAFEVLCDEMHSVEAMFCGHDHLNNSVVKYKGVYLAYNYSIDNSAYSGIWKAGLQRGASVITVAPDGAFSLEYKNAYSDYGISTDAFYDIYMDRQLHPEWERTVK